MKKIITLTLCIFLVSLVLSANTFEHKAGGISIWFPNDWLITMEDDALDAEAPDEDAFAHLMVLPAETIEQAVDIYMNELEKVIKNPEITSEAEEVEMNGLTFFVVEGVGTVEGVEVEVGVALIVTPKAIVLMITVNTPESNQKYGKDFDKIVQSIQAI